jgi:hypothetical protein
VNPPTEAILWDVRLRADPKRVHSSRARTAWAAWNAAAPHLGFPAYCQVECTPQAAPTLVVNTTPPVVEAIVTALRTPATLDTLRKRLRRVGRRHLSTEEVVLAVSAGRVEWDHRTQRYQRTG